MPVPSLFFNTRPATDAGFTGPRGLLARGRTLTPPLPPAEPLADVDDDPLRELEPQLRQPINAAMSRTTTPTATATRLRTGRL